MCYNICRLLLASQFMSDFCKIPDLYAKFPAFYANIFLKYSNVTVMYVVGYPNIVSGL